jgi:hypothetical protein
MDEIKPGMVMVPENEYRALLHLLDAAENEPHATPRLVNGVRGYYLYKLATTKKESIPQQSPYLSRYKFGQCLICGANHGGLACPDSNVTTSP